MTILNGIDYGAFTDVQYNVTSGIDASRDQFLYDKFVWDGRVWDCSSTSRANINGACTIAILNGGNLPPGFIWRDYTNTNWPVTATDMANMAAALATFTFTVYQVAWYHKGNILAITDEGENILDVIAYDYSTGWPATDVV